MYLKRPDGIGYDQDELFDGNIYER